MSKITYITIGSKTYELHDLNALLSSDIASWAKQPNKPSYTANEVGAIATSAKGTANGVAPLNSSSKIDSTYLPSYVDDVLEYTSKSDFPTTGETGKIYVDKTTNLTWRWGGSSYVEISPSLALGETSSTAYRGDRGKIAYDHAAAKGSAFVSGLYKITTNSEGHVTAATAVAKSDITALGIPAQDTTYSSKSAASGGTDVSLVTTGEKYTWNSKTSNTGTVTSVTVKGGTGVSVDSESAITTSGTRTISLKLGYMTSGNNRAVQADSNGNLYVVQKDDNNTYSAGSGLSLSGSTFNHSNSVTAQTTQALYPIKIDAQGHISAYGSAVSVPTSAANHTTGITVADHSTTTIYGVQSSTTTASKASGANGSTPSLTYAIDGSDSHQLNISWSAGSASTWSFSNVTVPIKNGSTTTVVTSKTHTVNDSGHTHTLS